MNGIFGVRSEEKSQNNVNVHIYPRVAFSRSVHLSVNLTLSLPLSLSLSLSSLQLFHLRTQTNHKSQNKNKKSKKEKKRKEEKPLIHTHSIVAMGKLLCDSTTVAAEPFQGSPPAALPWRDPKSPPQMEAIGAVDLVAPANVVAVAGDGGWEEVIGLEDQQRRHLQRLHAKGVLWKPPPEEEEDDDDSSSSSSSSPSSSSLRSVVFCLSHGGEVSADGNCLFTASRKAMCGGDDDSGVDARELRRRTVARFLEDLGSAGFEEREAIDDAIRHMYSPDLKNGWGIHVVQEVKLLAKKQDRFALDSAIDELVHLGMQRYRSFLSRESIAFVSILSS